MSLRLILAATAALAVAAPALAQDTSAASPPPAAAPTAVETAKSPEVLAFESRSEAFGVRLAQLQTELEAAIAAAAGDQAKGMADIETILARYAPEIDAHALEMEAFYDRQIAAHDASRREALISTRAEESAFLRGMVNHVRTVAPQFIAAAAATPAAAPASS